MKSTSLSHGPHLPTYRSAAATLEGKTGSGWGLAGWTVARTIPITLPFLLVGVAPKKAIAGGLLASMLISGLTLLRIFNGQQTGVGLGGVRRRRRR